MFGDIALAKQHFETAERLFSLGRFAAALVEYEAAFDAEPLPEFLFNMGQAHRNLGHLTEAVRLFRRFLQLKPDSDRRVALLNTIADLEAEIRLQQRHDVVDGASLLGVAGVFGVAVVFGLGVALLARRSSPRSPLLAGSR